VGEAVNYSQILTLCCGCWNLTSPKKRDDCIKYLTFDKRVLVLDNIISYNAMQSFINYMYEYNRTVEYMLETVLMR